MSSLSVIRARLLTSEEKVFYLWRLMTQPYSELIQLLLDYIANHPDFPTWLDKFRLPDTLIKQFITTHQTEYPCQELPGRFRDSAVTLVKNIYASWFAQKRSQLLSLQGKKRFLSMLKSDEQLQLESGYDLYTLTSHAQKLLQQVQDELEKLWEQEGTKPPDEQGIFWKITNKLYELHDQTQSVPKRCVIAYLIKNGNHIPNEPEDPEAYLLRRTQKEIQIQRLEDQIHSCAPHPRLLDDSLWLNALNQSLTGITEVKDLQQIQRQLLQKFPHLPYPVFYNTNTDLEWSINDQGRICVSFNGLKKKGIILEIACDERQLPYFQRILFDYQCFKRKNLPVPVPGGLMLLRSAQLIWKPTQEKGEPWNTHHLYLHCTINNRLWSKTDMAETQQELIQKTEKEIHRCFTKEEKKPLTNNQKKNIKRLETSLERLKTFDIAYLNPFQSHPYQGNPNIIVGVAIGLKTPITIAIIDLQTQATLGFRSPKKLLSRSHQVLAPKIQIKDQTPSIPRKKREITDYELFQDYLHKKRSNKHERHKAQKKFADNQFGEANAGLYFSRLFAQAIVEVAHSYQASVIVLPDLTNIREAIESEVKARAELKYPGNKTQQQRYAKDFRVTVNQWNYNQLGQCISNAAHKAGLKIATLKQTIRGSSQQKARQIALTYWEKQQQPQTQSNVQTPNNPV